jgi:hypothetical protein
MLMFDGRYDMAKYTKGLSSIFVLYFHHSKCLSSRSLFFVLVCFFPVFPFYSFL